MPTEHSPASTYSNPQPICLVPTMGLDDLDTSSDKSDMSAAPQSDEASPFPWPGTPWPGNSCVSSPIANRAGTLQAFGAAAQRSAAQLIKGPAVLDSPAAKKDPHAVPPGQLSVPLGCILIDPDSVSPALCQDRHTGAPASPVPHAEKENTPSPEKINLISHTAQPQVAAEAQASREAVGDIHSRGIVHRQAPLQQLLQQASPLASGAPAHHSLQIPAPSKQDADLKQRPSSAQVSTCILPTCPPITLQM